MADYKVEQEELFEEEAAQPTQESHQVRKMVEDQATQMGGAIGMDVTVEDGMIYFGSGDKHVYCLNEKTGELVWKYLTGGIVATSPSVVGGVAYAASLDSYIYALDSKTGELIWKFKTGDQLLSSPSVAHGKIYIGSFDSYLYCIDARTGELGWKYKFADIVWCTPAVMNGKVFVGSIDKRLYCLDAFSGSLLWSYLTTGWISTLCLATTEGKGVWNYTHRGNNGKKYDNLTVLSETWSEDIFLLREDGSKIWQKHGDTTLSTPTVHDGKVFTGGRNNYLYCLDFRDGSNVWKFQAGASIVTDPWIEDGVVYFGCLDTYMYAVSEKDGSFLWKFKTGGPIITSPKVSNGTLYIGSWDCHLYAMDTKTQEVKWAFRTGEMEGKPVFIKHLGTIERFKKRLRSFFRPEAKKPEAYEKGTEPQKPSSVKYGITKTDYQMTKETAYHSNKEYGTKINLDEEFKKRLTKRHW